MRLGMGVSISSLSRGGRPPVLPGLVRSAVAWDTFQGTLSTDLASHTLPSGIYSWSPLLTNTANLSLTGAGAVCKVAGPGSSFGIYTLPGLTQTDCSVGGRLRLTATPGAGGCWMGVGARMTVGSPSDINGYSFTRQGTVGLLLQKWVNGSATTLFTYAPTTPSDSDDKYMRASSERDIRLECVGTTIKAYLDGVLLATATDATFASGSPGVFAVFAEDETTGTHCAGWAAQTGVGLWGDAGGTSFYRGGVTAVRSNGFRIDAGVNAGASPRLQWYVSTSRGQPASNTTKLSGATSAVLDVTSLSPGTSYFARLGVSLPDGTSELTPDWPVTTTAATVKRVAAEGDSLTYGNGATPGTDDYPTQLAGLLGSPWEVINLGLPSATTAELTTYAARRTDPWFDTALPKCVLVHWSGTNDLMGGTAAAAWANVVERLQAARAAKPTIPIVFCNCIDRQQFAQPADMATRISDFNTLAAANWGVVADAFVDLHASTHLQNAADATYFDADKVHLNATGYGVAAGLIQTAVLSL